MINKLKQMKKNGFFSQLLDKDNTKVSVINMFMIMTTLIGILLLAVPIVAISIDLYYNHTVTMSWSDIATFVGAVSTLFVSVGVTKAWAKYSDAKVTISSNNNNICCTPAPCQEQLPDDYIDENESLAD